jgi:hypothetical protein
LKDVIDLLPSSTKTGVLGKDLQREHEFRVAPNIFCMVVVDVAITIGLDDGKGRLPLAGQDDAANVLDEKELMRLRNPRNKCTFSFKYIYVDLTKCHGCQSICEDAVWLGLPEIYERLETPWGVFECPASGNARR